MTVPLSTVCHLWDVSMAHSEINESNYAAAPYDWVLSEIIDFNLRISDFEMTARLCIELNARKELGRTRNERGVALVYS